MRFHRTCLATNSCWYTSECLIEVAYPICSKQMRQEKRNSLSALSKRKKTPLAATNGVFLYAYFIELLSKSIVPLKRVTVKNVTIVLFFSSVYQPPP